jgi:hypothetical protein
MTCFLSILGLFWGSGFSSADAGNDGLFVF